ncbi:unnamed protein product [Brassicogethes aeneus]|uniref:Uncharacterized protein n=1 Tax=Brassicogethes aeneus TaxID=1431903 RepID=A0A9P0BE94_BRAAE|nr:unnamed protein product [Brassicogethes aeneus]
MKSLILFLSVCISIKYSTACNGYSITLHSYQNCVPNGVISVADKGTVTLDKDCNLVLNGCMNMKGFKTAQGKYTIKKAPLPPIEGEFNMCELGAETGLPVEKVLEIYGMPKKCPMPAKKICGGPGQKLNLSKYKNQLGMAAGKTDLKLELTHDNGKSCIEASISISKAKKG